MKWTTEKPTEPGWYWYRTSRQQLIVEVVRLREKMYVHNGHIADDLDDYTGEWQGPLTPNEAP